jgi:hypothetical protein
LALLFAKIFRYVFQQLTEVAELTYLQEGHRGGRVILVKAGWSPEEVAEWIRKADEGNAI